MKEIIISGIFFLIAVFAFVLSIRYFFGKGFLLNNAYLYATEQEREKMNKTPYYRQSAVVFLLIALIFMLNGFEVIFKVDQLSYIAIIIAFITIIYAILSTVFIEM